MRERTRDLENNLPGCPVSPFPFFFFFFFFPFLVVFLFNHAGAKNLIQKILKIDPKERLTIKDILAHEWLSGEEDRSSIGFGQEGVEEGFDHVGTSKLDESVIEGMASLGIDTEHLRSSLSKYQPDHLSALFFLLRKAKQSPSLPFRGDRYHPKIDRETQDNEMKQAQSSMEKSPEKTEPSKPLSLLTKVCLPPSFFPFLGLFPSSFFPLHCFIDSFFFDSR